MKKLNFILSMLLISIVFSSNMLGQKNHEYYGKLEKAPDFTIAKTGAVLYNQIDDPTTGWISATEFTDAANSPGCEMRFPASSSFTRIW